MKNKYENFLHDFGSLLFEEMDSAHKSLRDNKVNGGQYRDGYFMGLFRALELYKNLAKDMEIDEVGLSNKDIDQYIRDIV